MMDLLSMDMGIYDSLANFLKIKADNPQGGLEMQKVKNPWFFSFNQQVNFYGGFGPPLIFWTSGVPQLWKHPNGVTGTP